MGWFWKSSGKAATPAKPPAVASTAAPTSHDKLDARALFERGCEQFARQDLANAFDAMEAASRAAPSWAAPWAWLADITACAVFAGGDSQLRLQAYRKSHGLARKALRLDANEERALAVLGRLARMRQGVLDRTPAAVEQAMIAANTAFQARRLEEALEIYTRVARSAPTCAEPVKRAGNCRYVAREYGRAMGLFRRAIELDPSDPQNHHFLADVYLALGRRDDALAAALDALAANPAYAPAWYLVQGLYQARQRSLARILLEPRARLTPGADGRSAVEISPHVSGTTEAAAWVCYGTGKSMLLADDGTRIADDPRSPFAREVDGYRAAAAVAAGSNDAPAHERASPGLAALRKLAEIDRQGELATAVLLLAYDEAYRGDLEAWRRAHPAGVAAFVERFRLAPM